MQARTHTPTRWTLILRAQGSGAEARSALGELFEHYRGFITWLIARHRYPPDLSMDDLTQEFVVGLLRRDDIAKLDRTEGSFRSWLRVAVRNFLINEWDKWRTERNGRQKTDLVPADVFVPWTVEDDLCTRTFAEHTLHNALERQRAEARDKERFERLTRFLPGPQLELVELAPYAQAYGMSRTALAKAICLLRERFRHHLRAAIRDTLHVEVDAETASVERAVDAELQTLLAAYQRHEQLCVVPERAP